MSRTAKLYYDGNCPICNNYVRLLKRKLNPHKIQFLPVESNAKEFQFVTADNIVYSGDKAIEQLAARFPSVLNYFWMLPSKYQVKGLKAAYKVGSAVRKVVNSARNIASKTSSIAKVKKKKGCGCGGKR